MSNCLRLLLWQKILFHMKYFLWRIVLQISSLKKFFTYVKLNMMCSFEFYSLIFLEIHVIQNGYVHQINEKKTLQRRRKPNYFHPSPESYYLIKLLSAKVMVEQKKVSSVFSKNFFLLHLQLKFHIFLDQRRATSPSALNLM